MPPALDPDLGTTGPGIVLFDAQCVLCSWNAQFILTYDRTKHFRLASMQGAFGANVFRQHGMDPNDPVSLLVIDQGSVYRNSDAVLAIYARLSRPWCWLAILRWIPRFVRDPIYLAVARNRYRLFGRRVTCWLPSPEHQDRML